MPERADPYRQYVEDLARLLRRGRALPLGGIPAAPAPPVPAPDAPRVVLFSPHPDDECIVGLLALRLQREAGMRVVNVAVTHGSDLARRRPRFEELRAACAYLSFELVTPAPAGLERIDVRTRASDPSHWQASVDAIDRLIADLDPAVVFLPHDADWNPTHVGTHHLVMDALARRPGDERTVVETEYWGAMATPNLVVESSVEDLGRLMAALSFHAGEVRRNPYHVGLPAWMQDNVRRGGELVGGAGVAVPDFDFATLYRVRRWKAGRLHATGVAHRNLAAATNAGAIVQEVTP
jgi:LmbE family N-acetylglucosaminyl deacetylase